VNRTRHCLAGIDAVAARDFLEDVPYGKGRCHLSAEMSADAIGDDREQDRLPRGLVEGGYGEPVFVVLSRPSGMSKTRHAQVRALRPDHA
jgi:hypothetical protein